MPKDRLQDLQQAITRSYVSNSRDHDVQDAARESVMPFITINVNDGHSLAETEFLQTFANKIEKLSKDVDKIEALSKDVERIHEKMLELMADPKLGKELDERTADIKKLASDVFAMLKNMQYALEAEDDKVKRTGSWRARASKISHVTQRLNEAMNQNNLEFLFHRERCKRSMMRELKMTGNKMTDDQLEEIIQSGFPGTHNYSLMVDFERTRQAAKEIEDRHHDITKLEKSLAELADLFTELARLVTAQDDMIKRIEDHVNSAEKNVEDGRKEIEIAAEGETKARQRNYWIIIIAVTTVLILILLMISYVTIKKNIIGR